MRGAGQIDVSLMNRYLYYDMESGKLLLEAGQSFAEATIFEEGKFPVRGNQIRILKADAFLSALGL